MKKGTQVSEKIPAANRQYKDTVFRMLFSEKENLLSLYNAVTGNAYQNADDLKIVTLENAIYMGMKNDLAFMLETNIYLYEHQSTLNPNIPLRDLIYIGIEYQQYVMISPCIRPACRRYRHRNLWYFIMERMQWMTGWNFDCQTLMSIWLVSRTWS